MTYNRLTRGQVYLFFVFNFLSLAGCSSLAPSPSREAHVSTRQRGMASFYGDEFVGRKTASGEIYLHSSLTAAHPSLPFGTWVRVTDLLTRKSIIVKINDRGPFVSGRIIDLSRSAAQALDLVLRGTGEVFVEVLRKTRNSQGNADAG